MTRADQPPLVTSTRQTGGQQVTDWRSYSVVQDKDGDLWGGPNRAALSGRWNRIGSAPLKLRAAWSDELETAYGPLTPVLDADGLPVVHTVGDLTARHQLARPRIRVAGREGKLKIVKPSDAYPGTVTLIWGDCWEDAALEEPCEVLP